MFQEIRSSACGLCRFNWEHSRMENSVLDSWAFGHTHHNADFSLHGTRLLCNQFGYGIQTSE